MGEVDNRFKQEFTEKVSNDFNTSQALALTFAVLKSDLKNEDKLATILDFDKVLGLKLK